MRRHRAYEFRSVPGCAASGYRSMVTFDDLSTNREADTGPFVFRPSVQTLKDREYFVEILFVEADAVVLNGQLKAAAVPVVHCRGRDLHDRGDPFASELQSVSDEILKKLLELKIVREDERQF